MRPTITALAETVAITVCTLLGTGILGLPVSLYRSGIQPFLLLFAFNFVAQICVVYGTTELLLRSLRISHSNSSKLSAYQKSENGEGKQQPEQENNLPRITENEDSNEQFVAPSLHSMAKNFLHNKILRWIFSFFVMSHFILILVSYTLAGPMAYSAIIPTISKVPVFYQTTFFLLFFSIAVYYFNHVLIPTISVFTLFKGTLLVLIVVLTLIAGLTINQQSTSNWTISYLVDPLLMGGMAISGVVNLMPVAFQTCLNSIAKSNQQNNDTPIINLIDRQFVIAYKLAVCLGVFICFLLNIVWCYAVLFVVPQNSSSSTSLPLELLNTSTLEYANEMGEISTIPLMKILEASSNKMNNIVGFLVNLFIAISLTISSLIMTIGMLHYLRGSVLESKNRDQEEEQQNRFGKFINSIFARFWIGGIALIYIIAVLNPQGVLRILEGFTSLSLNVEAGIFIVYMQFVSRSAQYDPLLLQEDSHNSGLLSNRESALTITYMAIFFSVAVIVDVLFYLPKVVFGK